MGMLWTEQSGFNWTELIDDLNEGRWINPLTGKRVAPAPYEKIVIRESLRNREAELVTSLGFGAPFAVISDSSTRPVMGERVTAALASVGKTREITFDHPHADMATVRDLAERLKPFNSAIAVGSGTINDLVKCASLRLGRKYCIFATAGSMNGYTSSTASITLDSGLKVTLPAQVPAGFFVDLEVCAGAPTWLNAAGFGDCLSRSVAQIDWWMSHRLLGTQYRHEPYLIEIPDEILLMEKASGIANGDIEAVGILFRVLTLCGFGTIFTGVSNHGSMGEHQISHYIDCFAGDRHPGSTHGQQVGVASLTMARIQHRILAREKPPEVEPTRIDRDDMVARMGEGAASQCIEFYRKKAFDNRKADIFNSRMEKVWPELRTECLEMAVAPEKMQFFLGRAGGPTTANSLRIPVEFYRESVRHAHEIRDRFSFADIACDSGVLPGLASAET